MSGDAAQFNRGTPPWLKYTIVVALMIATALVLVVVFNPSLERPTNAKGVGTPMPELNLVSLTDHPPPLDTSALKGHVTLINFWGPWCKYCIIELPDLLKARDTFGKNPRFRFVSVSCSPGLQEDVETLRKDTTDFLAKRKIDLPCYCDPDGATRSALMRQIDFVGYPTTVLVDDDGIIRAVWSQAVHRDELFSVLEEYVK